MSIFLCDMPFGDYMFLLQLIKLQSVQSDLFLRRKVL